MIVNSGDRIQIHSIAELENFWRQTLSNLNFSKLIILLNGDVGAGKTTSVKCICKVLNLEPAASPSFAIQHTYKSTSGREVHHADLYRIQSEEDLESTGFWDIFAKESWVIIEWADLVSSESWPLGWPILSVNLVKSTNDQNHRVISATLTT